MNLKNISNNELHKQTLNAAEKERLSTIEVLWHLRENEKRMLYAQMGYRDLKEYCVKELKFSEGSAWRRIVGMRALKEHPEVESKIQSGTLSLTQITLASTHFKEVKASISEKKELLLSIENHSTRDTERLLAEAKPEGFIPRKDVIEKPLRGQKLEVTLILDEKLQNELKEIQILLGKKYSKLELLKLLAKEKLETLKKDLNKKPKYRNAQPALTERKSSRYISKFTAREIKIRDRNQCQYVDPMTQRQCTAQFHLQTEHIHPFAKKGSSRIENLQLLCATHNQLRAVQQFGVKKMKQFLPVLIE